MIDTLKIGDRVRNYGPVGTPWKGRVVGVLEAGLYMTMTNQHMNYQWDEQVPGWRSGTVAIVLLDVPTRNVRYDEVPDHMKHTYEYMSASSYVSTPSSCLEAL